MDLTLALIIVGLLSGLSLFLGIRLLTLSDRISNELRESRNELREARAESDRISNELRESRVKNERASNELAEANAENERISNELREAREKNQNLFESNENALWLLYLLQLALQMYSTVFHDEQQQLNRLRRGYQNFVDEVKSKRDRRLMRKGVFIVLNLIPGVSVLSDLGDILSDIGDIGDLSEIAEVATETNNSELEDLKVDSDDPMTLNISSASARIFLGISIEKQTFKDSDTRYPEAQGIDFVNTIKRLEEETESYTPAERKEIITRIAVNFGEFGIEYYRSEEAGGLPRAENSSNSQKTEYNTF
ncbi:hypothetical protein F4141_17360 [Candidatus Poribacteria bacterium]|nr:hypothetical protein [Candidatus Poribacteria bacterium]